MNLAEFVEKIKVQQLDEYIQYVVNVYAEKANTFNSLDGNNLRELFRYDTTSLGEYDREDYSNFFNKKLVADFMKHKGIYAEYAANTKEGQVSTYQVCANEVVKAITPFKGYVTLDSSRLRNGKSQINLEHSFTLNVDAKNIYKVVRALYQTAIDNNIDFFITMPVDTKLTGVRDFISILCETECLESTLKLFSLLPSDIKSMCKEPSSFGGKIDGWIGYVSLENNQDISSVIGKSIIQGIDAAIREFANVQPDVGQYVAALDTAGNKDEIRFQVLKIMREINPDAYRGIVSFIKVALNDNNIDLDNLFLSKGIASRLGFNGTVEASTESVEAVQDPQVDMNPQFPEINVENGMISDSQVSEEQQVDNNVMDRGVMPVPPIVPVSPVIGDVQNVLPSDGGIENVQADQVIEQPVQNVMPAVESVMPVENVGQMPNVETNVLPTDGGIGTVQAEQVIEQPVQNVMPTVELAMPVENIEQMPNVEANPLPSDGGIENVQAEQVIEQPVQNVMPAVESAMPVENIDQVPNVETNPLPSDGGIGNVQAEQVIEQPVQNVMPAVESAMPVENVGQMPNVETNALPVDAIVMNPTVAPEQAAPQVDAPQADVMGVNEIPVQENNDPLVSVPQANEFNVTEAIEATPVVQVTDANRSVYMQMGLTEEQLDTRVKDQNGADVTLYNFLESNETLKKVPVDASVTLIMDLNNADTNQVMKGAQFIVNLIVPYALRLGNLSVDSIIEKYASDIKLDQNKKKSLFRGLFQKKQK